MKAEYVITAFRNFLRGERDQAIGIIRMIEAGEFKSGNVTVAERLRRLVGESPQMIQLQNAPKDIQFSMPSRTLDSMIVSDAIEKSVRGLVREWNHRELLEAANLKPRNIVLLCGPSGNGKTSLAQAIAHSVGVPFGLVAYNEMIDSHVGECAKGVTRAIDFAATTPCMVFFDEADAITSARDYGESAAAKEMNRAVNQLLIKLDGLHSSSLVVFATNRDDVIDSAMRRRVHMTLRLESPGEPERKRMVNLCNRRWPMIENKWEKSAQSIQSFAGIEAAAMDAARAQVLSEILV